MEGTDTAIGVEFIKASNGRALRALDRIRHCLDQLGDEDIWWKPNENLNSIGVLILHLCGNLRQWIISGVGGARDTRVRYLEFKPNEIVPKAELENNLTQVVNEISDVFSRIKPDILLEQRRIQGFDETILNAIYSTLTHFELHAGQIVYITRLRLGDRYVISWKPANKEQGAE
jgi:hypothetical protein